LQTSYLTWWFRTYFLTVRICTGSIAAPFDISISIPDPVGTPGNIPLNLNTPQILGIDPLVLQPLPGSVQNHRRPEPHGVENQVSFLLRHPHHPLAGVLPQQR